MFCANCGKNVPEDIRFCPSCGAKIVLLPETIEESEDIVTTETESTNNEILVETQPTPALVMSEYVEAVVKQPELHHGEYTDKDRKEIKRYVGMIIIGVLAMVCSVLYWRKDSISFMNRTGYENEQKSTAKDEETVTEQLKQLVKTYTSAYYGGDVNTVAEIAVPLSDSEKSYCQILGNYFQGYTHGTFYNTNGVNDGEYIVCYVADVVPIQTEEVLPVMGYLYVETDEDGELYINNLYSSFGIEEGEDTEAWDDAKYNAMSEYAQTDEIVTAYQDWSDRYDEACNNATIAEILSQIYAE